jgi:hypothetical protein
MKNIVLFLLRLFVAVALIFALFKLIPYRALVGILKHSKKIYIFYGLLIFFASNAMAVIRWRYILKWLGIKIRRREAFMAFFSGLFFNLFFPSFIAGDVFRAGAISYRHGKLKKSASSVFMDRFSGSVSLAVVASFAAFAGIKKNISPHILSAIFVLLAIIGSVTVVIFSRRVFNFILKIVRNANLRERITKFHDELYLFREHPRAFFTCMVVSAFIHIFTCLCFYVTGFAFGLNLSFVDYLIVVPIIMTVALIPVSIAGVGTREAASVYFFSMIGVDKTIALSLSLINLASVILLSVFGGLVYLAFYHRMMQRKAVL